MYKSSRSRLQGHNPITHQFSSTLDIYPSKPPLLAKTNSKSIFPDHTSIGNFKQPTMSNMVAKTTLTDANMTVINDNPQPVTVTVTNNDNMSDTFPSSSNIPPGGSAGGSVSASSWPGQSSFNVNFASGETAQVDIGTGHHTTSSKPQTFSDGKSAVLLAPGPPMTPGADYHFWFFNGPGLVQTLANSILQANLPALFDYVNQNPMKIPVNDSLSFSITGINAQPETVQCVYASTLPLS